MKTKDSIHRLCAAALLSAAALVTVAFSSCSSDDAPNPIPDVPTEDGMATINLVFSAPSIESRADDTNDESDSSSDPILAPIDTEAHEDKVTDLWVYLFKEENDTWKLYTAEEIEPQTPDGEDYYAIETDQYKTVISNLTVYPGNYRVYVLANLKSYTDTSRTDDISPSKVKATIGGTNHFTEDNLKEFTFHTWSNQGGDATGVFIGALPMAAKASEIEIDSDYPTENKITDTTNGTIKISKGSITLKAPMTYICAKIRYSFFFDCTPPVDSDGNTLTQGFSYPYTSMVYKGLGVHNAEAYAALFKDEPTVPQGEKKYKEKNIIDDPSDPTNGCVLSQYPDDLDVWMKATDLSYVPTTLGKQTTAKQYKKAYQGIVYVPQNKATDKNNQTYLHLKVCLDNRKYIDETEESEENKEKDLITDYKIYLPVDEGATLDRGNFYDVIGKITHQGISFNVRVKKWVKASDSAIPMPLGL